MTTTFLDAADLGQRPRSFVPPGDRSRRLAHLDPRPLWGEPAPTASPWASATFWLAWLLVMPAARITRLIRRAAS